MLCMGGVVSARHCERVVYACFEICWGVLGFNNRGSS